MTTGKVMVLVMAAALGPALGGCGRGGDVARGPSRPAARPIVVAGSPGAAVVPDPAPAAGAVASSATRWLYARHRATVVVGPAVASFRRTLAELAIPASLRGGYARAIDVAATAQSPRSAIASWTIVDDRTRTPVAVALSLDHGRWRATDLEAD